MKRLKITFTTLAIVIGVGGAIGVHAVSQSQQPNRRNTAAAGQPPQWVAVDPENPGTCC